MDTQEIFTEEMREKEFTTTEKIVHYTGVLMFYASLFLAISFLSQHFSQINQQTTTEKNISK